VATSNVALAVQEVARNRNKVLLISGAAASDLTGRACAPTSIHWTYDTVALANGTGGAVVRSGGDTWFFITADYAFGYASSATRQRWSGKTAARFWARSGRR
jgi:branched-chain amino acid transport system substrate-binding protein